MSADPDHWWRTVLLGGEGGSDPGSAADAETDVDSETYIVLPRRRRPRFVVDPSSAPALAAVVRRTTAQRGLAIPNLVSDLTARALGRVAPRWSLAPSPGVESLRSHLGRILDADLALSMTTGPERVNRKPVVRCYAGDRIVAVAKLGPDGHTAPLVDNEAHWLAELQADPVAGLHTPRLVHHGRYGPSALIVMSVLPVESEAPVAIDGMPDDLLERFADRYRSAAALETSPWFAGLAERCADADDEIIAGALSFCTDSAGVELDMAAWHGDWSPWNVGRTDAGEWWVWDWERAAVGVPRGFDQVHRHVHYGAGLDAARIGLRSDGMTYDGIELTIGLYLLEWAARLIEGDAWASNDDNPVRRQLAESLARVGAPVGPDR